MCHTSFLKALLVPINSLNSHNNPSLNTIINVPPCKWRISTQRGKVTWPRWQGQNEEPEFKHHHFGFRIHSFHHSNKLPPETQVEENVWLIEKRSKQSTLTSNADWSLKPCPHMMYSCFGMALPFQETLASKVAWLFFTETPHRLFNGKVSRQSTF